MSIIELRVKDSNKIVCYAASSLEIKGKSVGDNISIFDEDSYSSKDAVIIKLN